MTVQSKPARSRKSRAADAPEAPSANVVAHTGALSDDRHLKRFAQLVMTELGIRMPPSKYPMLQSRLRNRMRKLGIDTLDDYERYLFDPALAKAEMPHFIDVVTTNKTDFFREPNHFKLLANTALPELARSHKSSASWQLRLWCAGCSSGQEVYTLAMVLSEYAARQADFDFSIWATDISSRVLDQARSAIYPETVIAPVPAELRQKYLLRSKDKDEQLVRVRPELRDRVRFARLNFMHPRYTTPGPFDVIFFRNVMIYFDKPTQQAVLSRQCAHLRVGGYLFISHTESISGLDLPLQSVGLSVFRKVR